MYFKGGFGQLANEVVADIRANGGTVIFDSPATDLKTDGAELASAVAIRLTVAARFCLHLHSCNRGHVHWAC